MGNRYPQDTVVNLRMERDGEKTIVKDVYYTAPLKTMPPYKTDYGLASVMILSTSSGIMSGDRFNINIEIGENCRSEVTSQSYEKIHKMEEGHAERVNTIKVEKGAILNYMPQPTIPFSRSAFENVTNIELEDESSKLIYHEILSGGRKHYGELFGYTYFQNLTNIFVGGKRVFRDNTYFDPEAFNMEGFGMYEGYTHLSNVVVVNFGNSKELVKELRELLGNHNQEEITFGVTTTEHNDIVIRMFGYEANVLELINTEVVKLIMDKENA
ncbi:MAG: urease accessory protein UreD [Clostridia bacterium]|nr:urease accessory protein UreD [Clostridia bacterium]